MGRVAGFVARPQNDLQSEVTTPIGEIASECRRDQDEPEPKVNTSTGSIGSRLAATVVMAFWVDELRMQGRVASPAAKSRKRHGTSRVRRVETGSATDQPEVV